MNAVEFRIFPLGAGAVTVEFGGGVISPSNNDRVLALDAALTESPFAGFNEAAPAYATLTVYFDVLAVRRAFPGATAHETVSSALTRLVASAPDAPVRDGRNIVVPVDFSPAAGPDLDEVASRVGISRQDAVGIFTAAEYRVYMIGFLPGFAYMGEVDQRLAAPRRATPRTNVPAGSVGIAGTQTGIYPLESPGGWQLIGRTSLVLFDPRSEEPCALRAGDCVRFVDIAK